MDETFPGWDTLATSGGDTLHLEFTTSFPTQGAAMPAKVVVGADGVTATFFALSAPIARLLPQAPVERVGMYIIQDDLPTESEMDDDGEYDWHIANSHIKV